MNRRLPRAAVAVLLVSAAACGMNPQEYYTKMRPNLLKGNYDAAHSFLEKNKEKIYSEDNRLLYYMDTGMVLSLGKKYQESNAVLEKGKQAAEDLWTESVGKNALAWVTTDNSLPYQGEDFEKVMLNFVAATNYIGMNDPAGARVEARQITQKLELYANKYAEEEGASLYKDDAFARWLSGKLAETEGPQYENLNDAWIDYKKAIIVYETDYAERYGTPVPDMLVQDSLRVLEALGPEFKGDYDKVRSKFPRAQYMKQQDIVKLGEIVLVHLSGEAPYKIDKYWDAQALTEWIRIAYPEFVAKPKRIVSARIVPEEGATSNTELGENVTAIAIQNLNDHMGRIKAKAIARAVAKYVASKAGQAAGASIAKKNEAAGAAVFLASTIFQIGSDIAERADKRSWITLPSEIWIGRAYVPPGKQKVKLQFLDGGGSVAHEESMEIDVQAGRPTFITYRTFQ